MATMMSPAAHCDPLHSPHHHLHHSIAISTVLMAPLLLHSMEPLLLRPMAAVVVMIR
jgi:hypothetical protein